ncbi:neutral/alkaline non-lysosomal ceramidase N-terminal domain-containing protein (plasmid) [Novosphingobium sp. BL-8A]|uniref:neutral/alkaline non-lysosomal ceramidase N-terminal domain-containing protein n=1 Tax=Novosphingobium sp. BL-8A TaxID=3127639 RepID=UPI003756BF91
MTGRPSSPTFTVGAERINITPTDLAGLNPMDGRAFRGVHDPIHARVIVLQLGREVTAFVSIDAIEVGNMDAERQRIARETGVAADHVMITATHDHSAPRLGRVTPGALAHPGGPEVDAYTSAVIGKVIDGIRAARAHAVPARYGTGEGHADVNVNRDEYTARGWTIGFDPDGPSDKTVHVIRFDDLSGRTIAAIVNYPVHANVMLGTDLLSGDLTGAAAGFVENTLGGGAIVAFAQSTIGDQAPRLFTPGAKQDGVKAEAAWHEADTQGTMLGGEVLRVIGRISDMREAGLLAAANRTFACPVKAGVDVMADMHQEPVSSVPIRLSLIRLDDVALGGVSGEVLTAIGTKLRASSPLRQTLLVSLVNDRVGYLPPDSDYDRPTFEVKGSPVQRGCAEPGIVEGLVAMIRQTDRQEN